ncbi:hypothetical protein GRI97_03240 [Altererythrobacter xixiisoli]|uniref:Uncharacterized protein n=1 Tax=Croceibacterium xixiisoli TaxID=1476466 RepID=A0A6I4TPZ2_9SPHN|nr:hypothetical protein [Croceibacterium xixiisoli]MXO98002.1 hypothetical protein [Croceibacterium xixiisoli]
MRKSFLAAAAFSLALFASAAQAAPSSFAEKDQSGHLFAHLTQGEDLPTPRDGGVFGIPNTPILYSVLRDGEGPVRMRFEIEGQAHEIALPIEIGAQDELSAWPMFISLPQAGQEAQSWLLGVQLQRRRGYSGGGASDNWLHLFRVDNPATDHGEARPVLSLPLAADKLIRACFSEADQVPRQNVCHDSYKFEALLHLDTSHRGDWPVLLYQSHAVAQPGLLAKQRQLPDRVLTAEEAAEAQDAACSVNRSLRYDPQSLRYEIDMPGADCGDYFLDE